MAASLGFFGLVLTEPVHRLGRDRAWDRDCSDARQLHAAGPGGR
jgi:hypothetical protein